MPGLVSSRRKIGLQCVMLDVAETGDPLYNFAFLILSDYKELKK